MPLSNTSINPADFIHEAQAQLNANHCDVLYLHPEGRTTPVCAVVTIAWMDRHEKAQRSMYEALDAFPEPTRHAHLEVEA